MPKIGAKYEVRGPKIEEFKKNKKKKLWGLKIQAGAELQKKKKYFLGQKLGKI